MMRVVLGVLAGLLLGAVAVFLGGERLAGWLGRGPDPQTIAEASLRAVQKQARLTVLTGRFQAVVTSEQSRLAGILSAKKTLIVPGNVRYEIDFAQVRPGALVWDGDTRTLAVTVPAPRVAGPEIDLASIREYKDGTILFALTDAEAALDAANRSAVRKTLLDQAQSPALTELARTAASQAVERTFLLPLTAAGFDNAKVTVTFAP